jgi:hypothetical protein
LLKITEVKILLPGAWRVTEPPCLRNKIHLFALQHGDRLSKTHTQPSNSHRNGDGVHEPNDETPEKSSGILPQGDVSDSRGAGDLRGRAVLAYAQLVQELLL